MFTSQICAIEDILPKNCTSGQRTSGRENLAKKGPDLCLAGSLRRDLLEGDSNLCNLM
jgi:hypothetical protein